MRIKTVMTPAIDFAEHTPRILSHEEVEILERFEKNAYERGRFIIQRDDIAPLHGLKQALLANSVREITYRRRTINSTEDKLVELVLSNGDMQEFLDKYIHLT